MIFFGKVVAIVLKEFVIQSLYTLILYKFNYPTS